MAELVLVRYGELALKSPPVRREFERLLRRNILDQFVADGITGRLRSDRGHLYVEVDDGDRAVRALCRVFGVTSVSRVQEVPTDRTAIRDRLLQLSAPRLSPGSSFAVRARRTGQHPFTSQELARDLGGDVLDRFADRGLHVDLEHPDVELFVEVRGPITYLYFDRDEGPGGLPLGVAGHLVALVDGPRGALGAFLMMKRGCRVGLVAVPSGESLARGILARFDPGTRLASAAAEPAEWSSTVQRLADDWHADGVVLPIPVEEFPEARAVWGARVLFSPTVGLSDDEVEEWWKSVAALAA
ncbi:MAG TPA: THUMP domain-containing protein [Thermoplasmata archaeon]|nr:THUMP domain-containing protein [Thermoplasmata archaeon]